MNRGTIKFSKTGSNEILAEFPFSSALPELARVKLTRAGNTDPLKKENASVFGGYLAYIAATLAHVEGLPKIKPEEVTEETMLEFNCLFDFVLEMPDDGSDQAAIDGETDENPTVTQPASS